MPDRWIDDHTGDETVARPGFRADLRASLSKEIAVASGPRRPWKAIAWYSAAAASMVALAVAFVATRDEGESAVVPASTVAPSTPTSTTPTSTTPTPTTPTANPVTVDIGSIEVQTAPRAVLHTTTAGSGDGQLGFEECQECDPARPWGPIVTDDGTILIADFVNARWLIIIDGVTDTVPMRDDGKVTGQPLLVGDELFVPEANLGGTTPLDAWLRIYDVSDLTTPLREIDVQDINFGYVHQDGDQVVYTGTGEQAVATVPPELAVPELTWGLNVTPNFVDVTWQGITRHWEFLPGWNLGGFGATSDGSVYLNAWPVTPAATEPAPTHLLRLHPDGHATLTTIGSTVAMNSGTQLSTDRVVLLESDPDGIAVVSYDVPK